MKGGRKLTGWLSSADDIPLRSEAGGGDGRATGMLTIERFLVSEVPLYKPVNFRPMWRVARDGEGTPLPRCTLFARRGAMTGRRTTKDNNSLLCRNHRGGVRGVVPCLLLPQDVPSSTAMAGRRAGGQTLTGLHRGTPLIRNRAPLGPYCRTMPRALWWS